MDKTLVANVRLIIDTKNCLKQMWDYPNMLIAPETPIHFKRHH